MKGNIIAWIVAVAYPSLHISISKTFKYWPDPPEKGWYAVAYHMIEQWAIVKQEPK